MHFLIACQFRLQNKYRSIFTAFGGKKIKMISLKFLNLLVIYISLTKIITAENSSPLPKLADIIFSLENKKSVSGQTERSFLAPFRRRYPHLFSLDNDITNNNNNYLESISSDYSDVLNTRDTLIKPSDLETYSRPTTYTTRRIVIPIGLIFALIGGACKCCCKSRNDRSVKVRKNDQKGNFAYVPKNVIPTRQDGQTSKTDNSNGTGPLPAYKNIVIPQIPTYEEITEKRNKKKRNKKIKK